MQEFIEKIKNYSIDKIRKGHAQNTYSILGSFSYLIYYHYKNKIINIEIEERLINLKEIILEKKINMDYYKPKKAGLKFEMVNENNKLFASLIHFKDFEKEFDDNKNFKAISFGKNYLAFEIIDNNRMLYLFTDMKYMDKYISFFKHKFNIVYEDSLKNKMIEVLI